MSSTFICKQCGKIEIEHHDYDGWCSDCVEFSPYKRDTNPRWELSDRVFWSLIILVDLLIWGSLILWWIKW